MRPSLRFAAMTTVVIFVGCGAPRYYPVRGVVLDETGAPVKELAGATIEFEAVGQAVSAVGEIQPNATFTLTSETPDDGCLPGEHRVVIGPLPLDGDRGAVQVIDPAYHQLETSQLTAEVKPEANNLSIRVRRLKSDAAP